MPAIDEVIQRYILDDQYSGPIANLIEGTSSLGSVVSATFSLMEGFGKTLLGIGEKAFETVSKLQTVSLAMEGILGSANKARETTAFVKDLADATGTFTTQALADATLQLTKFGLRAENVLPNILKLAAVNPGKGLESLVDIYGRLAEGVAPRPRQLANLGISKVDLQKQGITFNGEKILSDATKTFDAIEKVVESKFGKTLEKVIRGGEASLGRLKNVISDDYASIGESLLTILTPVIDKATQFFQFLSQSGFLKDFAKNVTSAFSTLAESVGGSGGLTRAVFYSLALAESLPRAFAKGFDAVTAFFVDSSNLLAKYTDFQVNSLNRLVTVLEFTTNAFRKIENATARISTFGLYHPFDDKPVQFPRIPDSKDRGEALSKVLKDALGPQGAQIIDLAQVSKQADELQKKYDIFQNTFKNAVPTSQGDAGDIQNRIAENTALTAHNTAKALDLKSFALGGGPLGQIGVTPVEIYHGRNGSNRPVIVNLPGTDQLKQYFQEVIQETVHAMQKQGALG